MEEGSSTNIKDDSCHGANEKNGGGGRRIDTLASSTPNSRKKHDRLSDCYKK